MVTKAKKEAREKRVIDGAAKNINPLLKEPKYWTNVTTRLPNTSETVLAVVHWEDDFYEVCQVQYYDRKAAEASGCSGITKAGWYEAVVDDYDYEFRRLRVLYWRPTPPLPAAIIQAMQKRQPRRERA